MEREADTGLLGDRDRTLEEPGEALPEALVLNRRAGRVHAAVPDGQVEARHRGTASTGQAGRGARPGDDGHPVVTEHLDPEPAHVPDQLQDVLELLLAAGEAEA